MTAYLRYAAPVVGFGLGFAYSWFIGCKAGGGITRNPWFTGALFAVMAYSIADLMAGQ